MLYAYNRSDFEKGLSFLVSSLDVWPSRPSKTRNGVKEEALVCIISGNFIKPIYGDDKNIDSAILIGFSKEEYEKARNIIERKGSD